MLTIVVLFFLVTNQSLFSKINFATTLSTLSLANSDSQLRIGSDLTINGILKIDEHSQSSIIQTNTDAQLIFDPVGKAILNGTVYNITGQYDLLQQNTIFLKNGQTLTFNGDIVSKKIIVSGVGNKISGSAIFTESIELADENTELQIGIFNKLTRNLYLNGGTLFLLQDLNLQDDVEIVGPGTINFNGFSMNVPNYTRPTSTASITYQDANDITYSVNTTISTNVNWTGTSNLRGGAGIILTFTSTGSYTIANNATVYANGVHFKGLGVRTNGSWVFGNANSRIFLSNCTMELSGNFTQSQGQVIINGSNCNIIADYADQYIVSGATTKFTVDGQVLEYVSINKLPNNPITTTSGGTVSLLNGGDIRSATVIGGSATLSAFTATASGTNYLNTPINLSDTSSITFVNENIANAKSMIFDGQNTTVTFGPKSTAPFIVNENVTLTIQNVTFENYNPARFALQGSGATLATIIFGDNVIFEISEDIVLDSGSIVLTGNTIFVGISNMSRLDLSSQAISLSGANKSLSIEGLKVICLSSDSIKLNTSTNKLVLQASEFCLSNSGFTFDTGSLDIKDTVNITGSNNTTPDATTTFSFTSQGLFTITSRSALRFCHDIVFLYSPNTAGDGGVSSVQKRHFKFTDPSSTLFLQNATINCGTTGLAFDYGKLIFEDVATIITPFTTGAEFELGTAVSTKILKSGNLNLVGLIKYITTTYP